MEHLSLKIDGMSCGHCVARVEKALKKLDGVGVQRVEVGLAEIAYDPARTTYPQILAALDDAGYTARNAAEGTARIA
jgi:copper chaperone